MGRLPGTKPYTKKTEPTPKYGSPRMTPNKTSNLDIKLLALRLKPYQEAVNEQHCRKPCQTCEVFINYFASPFALALL